MKLVFQAWRAAFNFGVSKLGKAKSKLAKLALTIQCKGFRAT